VASAHSKRLGVGRVLARTFPIWGRYVVPLTLLNGIVYAPFLAIAAAGRRGGVVGTMGGFVLYSLVVGFGWCLAWFLSPLAVIQGVLQRLRDEPLGFLECLRIYFTRLLPALGAGLVVGLLATLCGVLTSILSSVLAFAHFPAVLTFLVFLVPPMFIGCMYWVAIPVAAVERRGVLESLRRAAYLSRGSRLAIFAIVLLTTAFQLVPTVLLSRALGRQASPAAGWAMLFLFVALGSPGAVAAAVAYHDLRLAKDGVGVEDLKRVFA
jgi:hypothetical protein